ncbi:MAG: hypothetical protein IKA17_10190 [Clostridia bacterium]|nr:hypothetical protein [Clostridia bacterium]
MNKRRYTFLYIVLTAVIVVIVGRLVNLQVANGKYYREKSDIRTTRTVELIAPRGEILDRFGRSIVKNRTGYNLYIQENSQRSQEELNSLVMSLLRDVVSYDNDLGDILPVRNDKGNYLFTGTNKEIKKWKSDNGFDVKASANDVMKSLCERYSISDNHFKDDRIKIAAIRLDMRNKGFSMAQPYLFEEDVPISEIASVKEKNSGSDDICVVTQPVRDYPYIGLGAHMLGRVGVVNQEEYEKNKDNGYSINSPIGKDGLEKYLEEYLKGENGIGSIEQSSGGVNISETIEKAPIAGTNVSLTIDLDMQLACETALKETINDIASSAGSVEGGSNADAGSAVVIDVNTGEVLAMASYPSYDIKNFSRDYDELLNNPSKPLFNRALSGNYSPASTFKLLVGAAALEEGIIGADEEILDTGKYTFFKDYQPACWIFNQTGGTHGYLNVTEAIRDSCNVFFYDVGRRLTIEKINEYAKKFGFGKKSGIELSDEEGTGVVAGPENRKKNGGIWYPGDVCQTAIGQSDTLVTPLQLANYIATIANGGTRYRPHLIKSVKASDTSMKNEVVPEVLSKVKLSKKNQRAIVEGLRKVVTEGTAFTAFQGCKTKVAAKTGSAQTSQVFTNGICVAYAPYDDPQIAIACVIEKAGSGSNVAAAVRKIVDSYYDNYNKENDSKVNMLMK